MLATMPRPETLEPAEAPQVYFPDPDDFAEEVQALYTAPYLGIDLETTGLVPTAGHILLVALSDGVRTLVGRLSPDLGALLRQYKGTWIAHNAKFEYAWLQYHAGVALKRLYDTQLADQVLRCGRNDVRRTSSLAHCARNIGVELDKELQKSFIDADPAEFDPTDAQIAYSAEDARVLVPLQRYYARRLEQESLGAVMEIENALVPVLAEMETRGMAVDVDGWRAMLADLRVQLEAQEAGLVDTLTPPLITVRGDIYQAASTARTAWEREYDGATREAEVVVDANPPETKLERRRAIQALQKAWKRDHPAPAIPHLAEGPINLRSREQLLAALRELEIELPDTRLSTLQDYGRKNAQDAAIMTQLIEWRALHKLQSAFGENILEKVKDGRIYPSFNQLVRTGRLSCYDPNLQQIPAGKRAGPSAELAGRLRACFVAPPGRRLVVADYAAIEYRIAAELYAEEGALAELRKGREGDPHRATAARLFGCTPDAVTDAQRMAAKTINYAVIYGISAYGLAPRLDVTIDAAKALLQAWQRANPKMAAGLKAEGEQAVARGASRTKLGRRRLYEIPHRPRGSTFGDEAYREYRRLCGAIQRQAANQPIQGMSADITKIALINIHRSLKRDFPSGQAYLINCVHDEVIVECDQLWATDVADLVEQAMVKAARTFLTDVPVDVDVHVGAGWTH